MIVYFDNEHVKKMRQEEIDRQAEMIRQMLEIEPTNNDKRD